MHCSMHKHACKREDSVQDWTKVLVVLGRECRSIVGLWLLELSDHPQIYCISYHPSLFAHCKIK